MEMNSEKYNFREAAGFNVRRIIFDKAVREMCRKNACGKFGANHMCPPAVKDMDELKKEILAFDHAVLVTKVYPLKTRHDMAGMLEGLKEFQKTLSAFKEDFMEINPQRRVMILGAGFCSICETCTCGEGRPCRFPEKSFPSIEACGIDVMSLSKSAGVKYNNGKDTVTYLGVILYS